jgi:DNA-binding SARP family transcriptional activator
MHLVSHVRIQQDGVVGIDAGDIAFVRVLGPIQVVTTSGRALDLPSVSQRRLLARLAVDAPRALRVDLLCDVLAVSPGALRTTVSRLRRGFGDTTVVWSQGRYRLAAAVDAALFTTSLSQVGAGDDRIGTLERALALWTGPAFDEFSAEAWAAPEAARLAELRASAIEDHAVELIVARRWAEAVAELKAHVSANPLRDRPWGLLVQALGGAGRQADALAAFQEYRAYLAEWVGTEPSAEVRRIQRRIAEGWNGIEAGWDGIDERDLPVRSGSAPLAGPPSWPGNGWLPLQAELARGTAVIGRARELELLAAEAALVGESGSRTVIVEGEAGIGKTTVLGAFARAVRDKGSAAVLYGRCQDGPAVPLEPFRSLIGHLVEHAPAEVLRAHVTRCGGHLVRIAPRLAGRVELAAAPDSDDATERHLLFEAVSDVLTRLAAISPLVVLLDDIQWAEPTAVQLLRHLGRALVNVPVLLVLGARDTDERRSSELRAVLADLERRPGRRICLGGFDADELADLTASLLAVDAAAVTSAVSARLRDQTAGNPLYATQLVRHWAESGHLALAAAEVEFAVGPAGDEVPANLRNLLWSRVSSLGGEVVEVLSAAAVLGTQFAVGALIDMVGISEGDAVDALDVAEAAGLLVDVEARAATLRFVHILVARAVYAGLPRGQRRRLHAQAAQVLAKQADAPTIELAGQIARHYALGGMLAEACHWATTAGDDAAEQLSSAEAARWYRTALDHGAILDVPDHARADLLVRLGHAQQQADLPGALATLTEAAALARRCGATAIMAQAALATDRGFLRLSPAAPAQVAIVESALEVVSADPTMRARLLALLAESLVSDVAGTRRTELAREAVALADASPDPALLARICSSVLYALWGPGHEATRLRADVAKRSIAAAAAASDPHLEFGVHAAAYTVAIQLADPAGAARSLERLRTIADQIGAPRMTWTVGYYEAFVATMQARFADADRLVRETVLAGLAMGATDSLTVFAGQAAVLATIAGYRAELPPFVTQAIETGPVKLTFRLAHAIVSVANGPRGAASDLLGEAVAAGFRHVPPDLMWMTSMLGYAILAIKLEDLGAAAQILAIIEPYTGEVATNLGPVAAHAGRLASLLGRHDAADQNLNAAFEIADAFDWDYHRAAILMARAAARRRSLGQLDDPARGWLATAEGICAAHGLPGMLAAIGELRG